MPEIILSDYLCGDETSQFSFFRIPSQLISHPLFKRLSSDTKMLYGMLLNRMGLSAKNGWHDDAGRVYIYYTVKEVCETVGCGRNKAIRLLAELDTGKGIGLIERVKQGQGRPDRIFVKRIAVQEDTEAPSQDPDVPISQDDFSNVQRSGNPTSNSRENRPLEVSKVNPSYIDKNQTDFIHTDQSIYPPTPGEERTEMDGYDLREKRKEKIKYERLRREYSAVRAFQGNCYDSAILSRRCPVRLRRNASHGETHLFEHTNRSNYPKTRQRTAPPTAVLSEQVCHLLNTNDHLLGGKAPLKPPINEIRLTVRRINGRIQCGNVKNLLACG